MIQVKSLLEKMMELAASDMHICAGAAPTFRIDGKLTSIDPKTLNADETTSILETILTPEQLSTLSRQKELDFSFTLDSRVRFRANYFFDKGCVAAAFRLIPTYIPTLQELGMPSFVENITKKTRGLVLVTGPTGSGKSTTLAAMVNHINTHKALHIITIEDPIEYIHTHKKSIVNQRELGSDTHSFANALRSSLREDPDVILVGEMRDLDTIKLAISAAETGHLVFGTLHTNTAAESVDRIIDVFEPAQQSQIRVQLANNLQGIISQQLLPRKNSRGRIAAIECMMVTSAIRNLIRENKTYQIQSLIQTGAASGMVSMDQSLKQLVKQDIVERDIALEHAINPEELAKSI